MEVLSAGLGWSPLCLSPHRHMASELLPEALHLALAQCSANENGLVTARL